MDLLDALNAPPDARRRALDAWRRARSSAEAGEALVRDLAPLFDADDAVAFLNAEGMWVPLAEMAKASSARAISP